MKTLEPHALEMLDPDPDSMNRIHNTAIFASYNTGLGEHDLMAVVPFIRCSVCGAAVSELPTYEPTVPDRDSVAAVSLARFQKKGEALHH